MSANRNEQEQAPSDLAVLAAERLDCPVSALRQAPCTDAGPHAPEGAWFFWTGGRGDGRLLVSPSHETLWAASSVSPRRHLKAFLAGKRS